MRGARILTAIGLWAGTAGLALALGQTAPTAPSAQYAWQLPDGWPTPKVPLDNPMSTAKVALGRLLFYDTRLSANGTQSCATCHVQAHAFADAKPVAIGSTGQAHPRSSMSLVNIAYAGTLTWVNPTLHLLEEQALVPMFGNRPIELGLAPGGGAWLDRLRQVPIYRRQFVEAFGATPDPFTIANITRALASFERTIISARSPYDRSEFDPSALSVEARRGEGIYFGTQASCFRCHGGFTLASYNIEFEGRPEGGEAPGFFNTGLYNLAGPFRYPADATGLYAYTKRVADVGKFKAPTLRNIAVTAPYMHDGSIATLDAVLDHYAAGGRTIASGPHAGIGRDNPGKSTIVGGFALSPADRRALLAFLRALTDDALLTDARWSNPWTGATAPAAR